MRIALLLAFVALAAFVSAEPQSVRSANRLEDLKRSLSPTRHRSKGRVCVLVAPRAERTSMRVALNDAR